MAKKQVEITFKTITPLWTGDAWGDNKEIKPSSLIGSLRFWFEVICYFSGICEIEKENGKVVNFKEGRFEKEVDKEDFQNCLLKEGSDFQAKIKCLLEQKIPLPSIIFGTTNWKSLIEIEKIKFDENNFQEEPRGRILPNKNFFWASKSYQGKFTVIFKIEGKILEPIFFPLLTFMDKYGFWGGKWNIGYGRLKVESVKIDNTIENEWKRYEFDLSLFKKNKNIRLDDLIQEVNTFNDLIGNQTLIKIHSFICLIGEATFKKGIEELLKEKSIKRGEFRDSNEKRHEIFGKTGNPRQMPYVPQGSKILPYIYKDGEEYKGGFLSIVGLLNLD